LASLLGRLPAQQRMAAALFYVEDLSVGEVAEAMGLSEGAVKYHLHAARATLRGALEPLP
jgi:RNA polymerase sigma-70 factor (ECF subfamily)